MNGFSMNHENLVLERMSLTFTVQAADQDIEGLGEAVPLLARGSTSRIERLPISRSLKPSHFCRV